MDAFTDALCALEPPIPKANNKTQLKDKIRRQKRARDYYNGLRDFDNDLG